jgi:hypothetical protein
MGPLNSQLVQQSRLGVGPRGDALHEVGVRDEEHAVVARGVEVQVDLFESII